MPYQIEVLPDVPIIVFSQQPSNDPVRELSDAIATGIRLLDAQPEPVFVVLDIQNLSLGVGDIMQASNMVARGSNPVLHHPKVREVVYAVTDSMMRMALAGLGSATFGLLRVSLFETRSEALDYCYGKLGQVRDAADDDQATAG